MIVKVVYPAIFHPNDDGTITVTFPDIPGCVTEGKSLENAIYMAEDALALYLDTDVMVGNPPPPPPTAPNEVPVESGEYVTLIAADPEIYARRRKNKAVKRMVSLPEWMDERASAEKISLSKELQAALTARFAQE